MIINTESVNQSLVPDNQGTDMKNNVYMIRIMFAYIVVNVPQEKITTKDIFKTVWGSKRKLQKNLSVKSAINMLQPIKNHCSVVKSVVNNILEMTI